MHHIPPFLPALIPGCCFVSSLQDELIANCFLFALGILETDNLLSVYIVIAGC